MSRIVRSRIAVGIAIAFLVLAFLIVLTWYFPRYTVLIPKLVQDWLYPIDKNNQDLVRLAALPGARGRDGALHSDRLAVAEIALAATDDSCAASTRWRSSVSGFYCPLSAISSHPRFPDP